MACIKPFMRINSAGKSVYTSCGDCLLCREKRSMELLYYSTCEVLSQQKRGLQTTFVTLTYSDDNLPLSWCAGDSDWRISPAKDVPFSHLFQKPVPSLCRADFRDFNKRFRYYVEKFYGKGFPYKFLCTGEYGDLGSRPHFHFIAYGLSPTQVERCAYPAWNGRGHIDISPLGSAGTNYLVGYCSSLPTRNAVKIMFDDAHRERPFMHHSKNLGSDVLNQDVQSFLDTGVGSTLSGKEVPLPSYIRRKFSRSFDFRKWYYNHKKLLEISNMTEEQFKYIRYQSALERVRRKGIASFDESDARTLYKPVASSCNVHDLAYEASLEDLNQIPF